MCASGGAEMCASEGAEMRASGDAGVARAETSQRGQRSKQNLGAVKTFEDLGKPRPYAK